jgi:SCY1-like protein 2
MPSYAQRSFDYIGAQRHVRYVEQGHHITLTTTAAPEYALDEVLSTASDMYSLGCLIHAVHLKGEPPFKNFGNLGSVREHAGQSPSGIARLDKDLQGMSYFQLSVRVAE